jgi:hypothetical protein
VRALPVLPLALAAALAAACTAPPPVAEEKPKRKSFEEGAEWRPTSPDPGAAATGGTDARAQAIEQKWDQVRQSGDEAERRRLANEALRETRALADEPSGQ